MKKQPLVKEVNRLKLSDIDEIKCRDVNFYKKNNIYRCYFVFVGHIIYCF